MIALIAAALAAASPCPDVVTPEAMVCRAIRAQAVGEFRESAQAFEQAAVASPDNDPATARLWAAAGNMWLAAGENGKAALALDKALARPGLQAEQHGNTLLDRARVAEAQGDLKLARTRFDQAAQSLSGDAFYWYFGAALALREGDHAKAESAILRALSIAPNDASILFEAGHVAQFAGQDSKAREYWNRAIAADPQGPIGKAAREAMSLLGAPLTVKQ